MIISGTVTIIEPIVLMVVSGVGNSAQTIAQIETKSGTACISVSIMVDGITWRSVVIRWMVVVDVVHFDFGTSCGWYTNWNAVRWLIDLWRTDSTVCVAWISWTRTCGGEIMNKYLRCIQYYIGVVLRLEQHNGL